MVLVTGGFDPLHGGHIKYFQAARKLGHKLIVGLNSDAWLKRKKGKAFMSFDERKLIIENLSMVNRVISCNDDDDVGFNDGGSGESDLVGVSGELQDQSSSGSCGGGNAFSMTWTIVDGYDGQTYETQGKSSDIRSQWSDNGSARGDWLVGITADVSEAPFPANIANGDDRQDYDITWTAVIFEISLEPVIDIEDPTTA